MPGMLGTLIAAAGISGVMLGMGFYLELTNKFRIILIGGGSLLYFFAYLM